MFFKNLIFVLTITFYVNAMVQKQETGTLNYYELVQSYKSMHRGPYAAWLSLMEQRNSDLFDEETFQMVYENYCKIPRNLNYVLVDSIEQYATLPSTNELQLNIYLHKIIIPILKEKNNPVNINESINFNENQKTPLSTLITIYTATHCQDLDATTTKELKQAGCLKFRQEQLIKRLVKYNANPNIISDLTFWKNDCLYCKRSTPLQVAKECKLEKVLEIFDEYKK